MAFPKTYIPILKQMLKNILEETRKLKNNIYTDPNNKHIYEAIIEMLEEDRKELEGKLNRCLWEVKPIKEGGLDLRRAKAVPMHMLIEIKRNKALCPWHNDKHPSLQYYPKSNTVYCFVCNRGGDSIDVGMAIWNLNFKETTQKLCTSL